MGLGLSLGWPRRDARVVCRGCDRTLVHALARGSAEIIAAPRRAWRGGLRVSPSLLLCVAWGAWRTFLTLAVVTHHALLSGGQQSLPFPALIRHVRQRRHAHHRDADLHRPRERSVGRAHARHNGWQTGLRGDGRSRGHQPVQREGARCAGGDGQHLAVGVLNAAKGHAGSRERARSRDNEVNERTKSGTVEANR